MIIHKIRVGKL